MRFHPEMFSFCTQLTNINLSNCFELESSVTVKSLKKCLNLEVIILLNCTQFTEQQLTDLLSSLVNLEYVDCTGTQEMIFCNCLNIVCSLLKLRKINVEPKYLLFEKIDWQRMVSNFKEISFGHSIRRMLPRYGYF